MLFSLKKNSTNQENLDFMETYKPHNYEATHLRILLHGPVGAGKSSFINSVDSVLKGRITSQAPTDATSGSSFTIRVRCWLGLGLNNWFKTAFKFKCSFKPIVTTMLMGKIGSWITDHVIAFLITSNNIVFNPVSICNITYVRIISMNLQTSQSGTVQTIDINY